MVERRLQILMTSWRPDARAASAFLSREPSTNGPFQTERTMSGVPYFFRLWRLRRMNRLVDLFDRVFLPLVRFPPRGTGGGAAGGAAFAAAVRVIDRVHDDAAFMRTPAEPAGTAGLADRDVHVVRVGHRTNGAAATAVHQALLARVQPQNDVVMVAADQLGVGARGAPQLPALADLHLDIVDDGADRHVAERHDIARLDVDIIAGNHGVTRGEPLPRQDVGLLT